MDSTILEQLQTFAYNVSGQVRKAQAGEHADESEVSQLLVESQIALDRIARQASGKQDATTVATLGSLAATYWEHIATQGDAVGTSFGRLNGLLGGGLQAGRLMVLLGAPGSGKTTLANQVAHHVANGGVPVVYLTTEDMAAALLAKTIARCYHIDYGAVLRGQQAHQESIEHALREIAEQPAAERLLYVESSGALSLPELKGMVAEHFNQYPADAPGLLVVDYLQRVARAHRRGGVDLREAVTVLTEQLHDLARDLKCSVIALASQNRASGYGGGAASNDLSSAKESGDIEYTTDVLATLALEVAEGSGKTSRSVPPGAAAARLNIAKNRQGALGQVALDWFASQQRWSEAAK